MDIGILTAVLLGHQDPIQLYKLGTIQGEEQQLKLLIDIIPPLGSSLLFDFF